MKRFFVGIRKNYKLILIYIIILAVLLIELPYYIDAPGGLINISERIEVDGGSTSEGSFNLTYVSEYRATIPMLVIAIFNPNWTIHKKGDNFLDTSNHREAVIRDRLWIRESYSNAVILAFEMAGKNVEIISEELHIVHIFEDADTNLKVGDIILSINGTVIHNISMIHDIIRTLDVGDKLEILVENNNSNYTRYARIVNIKGSKLIGIMFANIREFKTTPEINISFRRTETGSSGGLILALAIYNSITDVDITGGLTIVGTGTIDIYGNVGTVGGIENKLMVANRRNADIFFVPAGENYEEARKFATLMNYKIKIVPVSTFEEAINYLMVNIVA